MAPELRFGLSLGDGAREPGGVQELARRLEGEGWDALLVADHLPFVSPFVTLAAAAAVTKRVRLGTLVVNNDWRNLAVLAQDAASVDLVSEGRLELGLGTGHMAAEYRAAGVPLESGGRRVDRLLATLSALRALFRGERVSVDSAGVVLVDHVLAPVPPQGGDLPILVGGNGDRLLRLAAERADVVGFTGFSVSDGVSPDLTHMTPDGLADRVAHVARAAENARRSPERSALIQVAVVGSRAETAPARERLAKALGYDDEQIRKCPFLLIGEVAEVREKIRWLRESYAITYLTLLEPQTRGFEQILGRV